MERIVQIEDELMVRCRAEEDTLAEVRYVLRTELLRAGLADIKLPAQLQNCRLVPDPNDGTSTLVGEWRKQHGKVIGSIQIRQNGELIAELGVRRPAPDNPGLRVERVLVSGAPGALQAELQFVPATTGGRHGGQSSHGERAERIDRRALTETYSVPVPAPVIEVSRSRS